MLGQVRATAESGAPPLMAVTANCDVLEAEEAGGDPALMPWIGNIRAAADEMAGRIADMLAGLDR